MAPVPCIAVPDRVSIPIAIPPQSSYQKSPVDIRLTFKRNSPVKAKAWRLGCFWNLGFGIWIFRAFGPLLTPIVFDCAAAPGRPNIVFILMDDLRWDEMDYPFVKVPHIQRIA